MPPTGVPIDPKVFHAAAEHLPSFANVLDVGAGLAGLGAAVYSYRSDAGRPYMDNRWVRPAAYVASGLGRLGTAAYRYARGSSYSSQGRNPFPVSSLQRQFATDLRYGGWVGRRKAFKKSYRRPRYRKFSYRRRYNRRY